MKPSMLFKNAVLIGTTAFLSFTAFSNPGFAVEKPAIKITSPSAVTVKGDIQGMDRDTYKITAQAGQVMHVSVKNKLNLVLFHIQKPGAKVQYLPKAGEDDDATNWKGTIPVSGVYTIIVGAMRGDDTSYALTVQLTGLKSADPIYSPLTKKDKIIFNKLFTAFSETHLESFTQKTLTDDALLQFALSYNYRENLQNLKRTSDQMSVIVTPKLVDSTTKKYFGRIIRKHQKASYIIPMADGDPIPFSQINTLVKKGNGTYLATGIVYCPNGQDGPSDVNSNPKSWKKEGIEVEDISHFTAIIKKSANGWILLQYQLIPTNKG